MKRILLIALICIISVQTWAQKNPSTDSSKTVLSTPPKKYNCDSVVVDFESGLINSKIGLASPIDSISKYLPCITTEIPFKSDEYLCGGGARLGKPGIFFNLENGIIEFTPGKAYLSYKLLGVSEDSIAYFTGEPVEIRDLQPYTDRAVQSVHLFPKSYGSLAVWVNQEDKRVFKIQMQNKPPAAAILCIE